MALAERKIQVFAGSSNIPLAQKIVTELGLSLGDVERSTFSDGETRVQINDSVRERGDVFVVQSIARTTHTLPNGEKVLMSPNDNLMEMKIMLDALKKSWADRVIAVVPYMGYSRQDRKSHPRDAITAKLIAEEISNKCDGVVTFDLHASQIEGFFNVSVDHLPGRVLLESYYKEKFPMRGNVVGVAADIGDIKRTKEFCKGMNIPMVFIDKDRPKANVSAIDGVYGELNGKRAIIIDDMIDTAGTICNAAEAVLERGAKEVHVCATHAILSGPAVERLKAAPVKEIVLLDTLDIPPEKRLSNMVVLSSAKMLALAMKQIHLGSRDIRILVNGEFNKEADARIDFKRRGVQRQSGPDGGKR